MYSSVTPGFNSGGRGGGGGGGGGYNPRGNARR